MSLAASCLLAGCHTLGTPGAFAACQAADAATTLYALDRGAEELNPIVAAILDLVGPPASSSRRSACRSSCTGTTRKSLRA